MGKKEKKETKDTNKIYLVVKFAFCAFLLITSMLLFASILKFNILVTKYIVILVVVLLLLNLLNIFLLLKKNKVLNVIGFILVVLLGAGFIFGYVNVNKLYNFIDNVIDKGISYTNYYIVVRKEDSYEKLEELNGKEVSLLKLHKDEIVEYMNNKIDVSYNEFQSIGEVTASLEEKKVEAMIISDSVYDYLLENDDDFEELFRLLYEFKIEVKIDNTSESLDVTKPFILYVSGLDISGVRNDGSISEVGLSDVNILAVVNPITHKILLVNTPRDYYVQLHGTTGMRDKLTHSGFYGVEMSVNTLQDLYDIKINAYLKVNYNAVESVIDSIDGIDINSDQAFVTSHKPYVDVKVGHNHFNGKEALAFSRERYAYYYGDRHRGANQQAVITAIIKKVSTEPKYLLKYDKVFGEINNYITTNIGSENIHLLLKEQLNSLQGWDVESIAVDGEGRDDYSYTNPTYFAYVMEPDMETVKAAQERIEEILTEV